MRKMLSIALTPPDKILLQQEFAQIFVQFAIGVVNRGKSSSFKGETASPFSKGHFVLALSEAMGCERSSTTLDRFELAISIAQRLGLTDAGVAHWRASVASGQADTVLESLGAADRVLATQVVLRLHHLSSSIRVFPLWPMTYAS